MPNSDMNEYWIEKTDQFLESILPGFRDFDFADKPKVRKQYIRYMLNRTQSMFRWSGLPDTIPARILELYLQCHGFACFYKWNGDLYVFYGGRGGEPDIYYMPTIFTIGNPCIPKGVTAQIDVDCVVMPNDSMYMGLMPMFERYATAMCETELSINIATINSRIFDLISATDDRTRESALKYLEDVRAGKLSVIATNEFLSGITAQPYGTTGHGTITDLIELMQYEKASWFNELGLNANYNMKRESLNSSESQLNNDALLPLIDDMLKNRQIFAEKVNDMFGTEISVELASSWEDNIIELENEQAIQETEVENAEMSTDEIGQEGTDSDEIGQESEVTDNGTGNTEEITNEGEVSEEEPVIEKEEDTTPVEVIVKTEVDIVPTETEEPEEESEEESEDKDNEGQTDDQRDDT